MGNVGLLVGGLGRGAVQNERGGGDGVESEAVGGASEASRVRGGGFDFEGFDLLFFLPIRPLPLGRLIRISRTISTILSATARLPLNYKLSHFLPDLLPVRLILPEEQTASYPAHDSWEVLVCFGETDVGAAGYSEGQDFQDVGDEGNVGGGEGEEVVVGVEEGHGGVGGHGSEAAAHAGVERRLGVAGGDVVGVAVGVRIGVRGGEVVGVVARRREGAANSVVCKASGGGLGGGMGRTRGKAGIYCLLANGLLAQRAKGGHRLFGEGGGVRGEREVHGGCVGWGGGWGEWGG